MNIKIKRLFPVSWKDFLITLLILACASGACMLLQVISENDFHVPLIFLLAVLLISFFTEGYLFGISSAFVVVFFVNYVFTYPYLELNFSLTGYPLTFLCMLVTSIVGCTMATNFKERKNLKVHAEREEMRANLLRTVSHDFRTPLTSIIGTLELVREHNDDISKDERDNILIDAKSEAEWLINMVENLLSVTRIGDDPKMNIHKEPQAVEELIAEATDHFRKQYELFNVSVIMPDEIIFADADATLIEQVINNILINAAIHAKDATMATISVEKKGGFVEFKVIDDGKGFAKEELPFIFDDYIFRSEPKNNDSLRGMGIGLSVCNTIVKAHGGVMKVFNTESKGACVSFTLPLSEVQNGIEA